MREVTQDQFYERVNPLDVVGSIVNSKWPYTHEFHMRSSRYNIIGRIVGSLDDDYGVFEIKKYYIE